MANAQGSVRVTAGGEEYTLFVGLSVLADLQETHGQDVLEKLEAPEGASASWMPSLQIVGDLFLGALQRHHKDTATRWIVDDIIAENADALPKLMGGSFPDAPEGDASGNLKKSKEAA